MKDAKWKKELESVRHLHALDLSALLCTTEELQRVKQELAITTDTKNQALTHARDATKIAEIHAEKIEILSAELARVKASMESRLDKEINEKNELISQLTSEVNNRKLKLLKIKSYEEKEGCIEQLNVELEATKIAEFHIRNLVEQWMKKGDALEIGLEQANRREKSASENLEAVSKKLKESKSLLHGAESEISSLHEIEESEHRLEMAKGEAADMVKKVEFLVFELEMVKEKNIQFLNNEKIAADSFQNLLEEKNKLAKELENLSNENEKNKEAMESLTAALHEVSTETRESKEKLLASHEVSKNYESEIENLNYTLRSMNEKYEAVMGEKNEEIDILNKSIELAKDEYRSSKEEWEKNGLNFMDCVMRLKEERSSMEKYISRRTTLLKEEEEKAFTMEEALDEAKGKA